MLFAAVVIGGVRSIMGSVIGAFVVFGADAMILSNLPVIGDFDGLAFIFTGVLIIIVVLYYPYGLVYLWKDFTRFLTNPPQRKKRKNQENQQNQENEQQQGGETN
jgi:branched-chain amino acid transport system permease protein